MNLYRTIASQEEIDQEYNVFLTVPDAQSFVDFNTTASMAAREELQCVLDERYGLMFDETIDIFPSETEGSPVVVFIHGGYWRSRSSRDFSMVARGLVAHGITVALPNYSLCPKVTLPEITNQNRAAFAWMYYQAHRFNGDPNRMFVCGHSAGGHQVGMLASTDWAGDYGLPGDVIKGGIAVSGIYDLSPLYFSWLQPILQLSHGVIAGQSPLLQIPDSGPSLLVSVGEDETAEFKRQSADYFSAWTCKGLTGSLLIQPGRNHFTAIRDLNDPESEFCTSVVEFMESCETG